MERQQGPAADVRESPGPARLPSIGRRRQLHDMLGAGSLPPREKGFLETRDLRDIYGTDALEDDQRLKLTSSRLLTDLKADELYERVGDIAAYELCRTFPVLNEIVRRGRRVVKTIGER